MQKAQVTLAPMTPEMYHRYFREYENDPALFSVPSQYRHYEYSREKVDQYICRQIEKKRITLAIMAGKEIVGEIILKEIIQQTNCVLSIALKNTAFTNRGYGTAAEAAVIDYVFHQLNIPTLFADTIKTNTRSQHVLQKVGFIFTHEDQNYRYYRIDRN